MKQLLAFVVVTISLTACAGQPTGTSTTGSSPASQTNDDPMDVVDALKRSGLRVEAAGEIEQPFWTRKARVFAVEGGDLQLYEFASEEAAKRAASEVSADGGAIGTTSMSWIAPPNFYRRGRVIAIYLGTNSRVRDALAAAMGPPFAQRS